MDLDTYKERITAAEAAKKGRRPIYCAHRAKQLGGEYVNFNHWYCDCCHTQWPNGSQAPEDIVIAYLEAE